MLIMTLAFHYWRGQSNPFVHLQDHNLKLYRFKTTYKIAQLFLSKCPCLRGSVPNVGEWGTGEVKVQGTASKEDPWETVVLPKCIEFGKF